MCFNVEDETMSSLKNHARRPDLDIYLHHLARHKWLALVMGKATSFDRSSFTF